MNNRVELTIGVNLEELKKAMANAAATVKDSSAAMSGAFDTARTSLAQTERQMSSLQGTAGSLKTVLSGVATVAVAKSVLDTAVAFDSLGRSLKAITGSAEGGAAEMAFVRSEANRLGLELQSTATAYKGILAAAQNTTMAGQGVRDIFTAITQRAAILGLSTEALKGVLWAVSQMMSKGKVEAQELKEQMGEHLPGAVNLLADAMGVSTRELMKMMEQGELATDEVLPKLAKALNTKDAGSVGDAANSAQASINRLTNQITELKLSLADATNMEAFQKAIEGVILSVKVLTTGVITLITGLQQLGIHLAAVAASLTTFGEAVSLSRLQDSVSGVAGSLKEFMQADITDAPAVQKGLSGIKNSLSDFTVFNQGVADQIKAIWAQAGQDVEKSEAEWIDKTYKLIYGSGTAAPPPPTTAPASAGEADKWTSDPQTADKAMAKYKQELEAKRDVYILGGRLQEWSLQTEREFWQEKLQTAGTNLDMYREIHHEIASVMEKQAKESNAASKKNSAEARKDAREDYESRMADLRTEMEESKQNYAQRIAIQRQMVALAAQVYGEESRQHKEQKRKLIQIEQEYLAEQRNLVEYEIELEATRSEGLRDLAKEDLSYRLEMGHITRAQALVESRALAEAEYMDRLNQLQRLIALEGTAYDEKLRLNLRIEQLEQQHNLRMRQLSNQAALDVKQQWSNVASTISGAFNTMLWSTQTWSEKLRGLFQSVISRIIDAEIRRLIGSWANQEAARTAATMAGSQARTSVETTARAEGMATSASMGLTQVMNDAYKAAAGAYASVSEIPIVGWLMAPIAAAAAFAAVAAFGSGIMSYDVGSWQIPSDRLALVHAGETIIPAGPAEDFRKMFSQGSGGDLHLHISAVDSKSFNQALARSDSELNRLIKKSVRDFRLRG